MFFFSLLLCAAQSRAQQLSTVKIVPGSGAVRWTDKNLVSFSIMNAGEQLKGIYMEVICAASNGDVFYRAVSERFSLAPGTTASYQVPFPETETEILTHYFSQQDSASAEKSVLCEQFRQCVYLKSYDESEITLAAACEFRTQSPEEQKQSPEEKQGKKKGMGKPGSLLSFRGGQAEYFFQQSTGQYFGQETPLTTQYLTTSLKGDIAGIPLQAHLTFTNGTFHTRQLAQVIQFEFDPQEYRRRLEEKKNIRELQSAGKLEDIKRKTDSLDRYLRGLDQLFGSEKMIRSFDRLRELGSLDSSLTSGGSLLDTAGLRQALLRRKELKDSLPDEKYLRQMQQVYEQAEKYKSSLESLRKTYENIQKPDIPGSDTLEALRGKDRQTKEKLENMLSKVSNFGVGTVFYQLSEHTISGVPISGGTITLEPEGYFYSLTAGKIKRNTTFSNLPHEQNRSTTAWIAGIGREIRGLSVRLHYMQFNERPDSSRNSYKTNRLVPLNISYRPHKKWQIDVELAFSGTRSAFSKSTLAQELGEGISQQGFIPAQAAYERLGAAASLDLTYALGKNTWLVYRFRHLGENYESLAQPFLVSNQSGHELTMKQKLLKSKIRLDIGAVYQKRNFESNSYLRMQPRLKLAASFPRKPYLILSCIPTYIRVYNQERWTNVLSATSGYIYRFRQLTFNTFASYVVYNMSAGTKSSITTRSISETIDYRLLQYSLSLNRITSALGTEVSGSYLLSNSISMLILKNMTLTASHNYSDGRGNRRNGFGGGIGYTKKDSFSIRANYNQDLLVQYAPLTDLVRDITLFNLNVVKLW
jgi:hypothetical protein